MVGPFEIYRSLLAAPPYREFIRAFWRIIVCLFVCFTTRI